MASFKEVIKRELEGEPIELQSIESDVKFWFCPRKISIEGRDAVFNYKEKDRKTTLVSKKARDIYKKYYDKGIKTEQQLLENMSQEDVVAISEGIEKKFSINEITRIYLKYGVGKNNLEDSEKEGNGLKESTIMELMKSAKICDEMFRAIENFNGFFTTAPENSNTKSDSSQQKSSTEQK